MQTARTQNIKGTNYVYLETSYRVPGKKYPQHKRTYIGKMDGDRFVPNDKFHALTQEQKEASGVTWEQPAPAVVLGRPVTDIGVRKFRGLSLLLSTISSQIGLTKDLEKLFGDAASSILSLSFYLVSKPDAPLYRFSHWERLRFHPYGKDISSPRSSELFASIEEDEVQQFLSLRVKRSQGTAGWLAVDTTSVSSYSQALSLVAPGRNKEHDKLDQINLLMVFDQDADIPVFYRKTRGNITDVTTVENTLHDLQGIGITHASLVLDRGFYSKDNVIGMLKKRYAFTLGTKVSLIFVKDAIKAARDQMMSPGSFDDEHRVFHAVLPVPFAVPVRGRGPNERNAYLHLYCDKEKEADDVVDLMAKIKKLRMQLETGEITASRRELSAYFTLSINDRDEITGFRENRELVTEAMNRCGFFALLTSEKELDSAQVLSIYRKKDKVEKSFNNLKDRLSLRRTRCSSDDSLNGKIFVQFIALILVSYIKKMMKEKQLYNKLTYEQLIDEVDVIEYFTYRNHAGHWGEITEKQGKILKAFDAELPAEAWPKSLHSK